MPVFSQGETYEEEDEELMEDTSPAEAEAEVEEEEEPVKKKQPKKKKKKRDKHAKVKIIACCVGSTALVAFAAIFMVSMSNNKRAAEEAAAEQEAFEHAKELYEYQQAHPTEAVAEETETAEEQPKVVEKSSKLIYSAEEVKALRKWGYTASELEIASRDGLSASDLVASAREDREAAQEEALAAVMDTASDEYKYLLNQTWLGSEPLDVSTFAPGTPYSLFTRTVNADYEKCDTYGHQCFVKVYLDEGPAFMNVLPTRYNELPQSGNIVVDISEITIEGVSVITDIKEKRVD